MNLNFLKQNPNSRANRLMYVGLALLTAILYDLFFWNQHLGLGFVLFVAIYLMVFLVLALVTNKIHSSWAFLLMVPIIILTTDVFVYNNILVQFLVPLVVFALLVVFTMLVTLRNKEKHPFFLTHIPLIKHLDLPFTKLGRIYDDLFKWDKKSESGVYKKIITGLIIALPLLFIFGVLFSSADAVFADWVHRMFRFDIAPTTPWRILRTGIFTALIASFFYVVTSEEHSVMGAVRSIRKLDSTIIASILGVINVFFLVFVVIQITYLFGGRNFVLENHLTFAEYARRGFFELVAVMVLSAGLLLFSYYSYIHNSTGVGKKILGALQILFLAQIAVIGFSALNRMDVYQQAYGFTVERLYVEWFIYFLLAQVVFAIVCVLVRWSFRNYFYLILTTSLVAFTLISSLNVDFMIARENVNRSLGDLKKLDLLYFNELSVDAAPALDPLLPHNHFDQLTVQQKADYKNITDKWTQEIVKRKQNWREWNNFTLFHTAPE